VIYYVHGRHISVVLTNHVHETDTTQGKCDTVMPLPDLSSEGTVQVLEDFTEAENNRVTHLKLVYQMYFD
jgi:hypothetical protein